MITRESIRLENVPIYARRFHISKSPDAKFYQKTRYTMGTFFAWFITSGMKSGVVTCVVVNVLKPLLRNFHCLFILSNEVIFYKIIFKCEVPSALKEQKFLAVSPIQYDLSLFYDMFWIVGILWCRQTILLVDVLSFFFDLWGTRISSCRTIYRPSFLMYPAHPSSFVECDWLLLCFYLASFLWPIF